MKLMEIAFWASSVYGLSVVVLCILLILNTQDAYEKNLFKSEEELKSVYLGSLWSILFAPYFLIKYFIKRMIRLFTW